MGELNSGADNYLKWNHLSLAFLVCLACLAMFDDMSSTIGTGSLCEE